MVKKSPEARGAINPGTAEIGRSNESLVWGGSGAIGVTSLARRHGPVTSGV